jgi:excisionase family DNA binding protein
LNDQHAVSQTFEGRPYLLRVSEVANILGISRASIYRLVERGDLKVTHPMLSGTRGSVRIVRDSAQELLIKWLEADAPDVPNV